MKKLVFVPALFLLTISQLAACSPASPIAQSGGSSTTAPSVPQKTLVVAIRGEPPSIAAMHLVDFSGSLRRPAHLFNGTLDYLDERGIAQPYLAETLPQLNTDNWKVNPDGTMDTTYRLKPNLTWHDGTPLTAEDWVFAARVYEVPAFGYATSPPTSLMANLSAPDPRTLVIRWRQIYPLAAGLDRYGQPLPRHILAGPLQDAAGDLAAFTALPFWTSEYVGLGPYRLTGWEPGAFITGEAFDGFVFNRPKIDKVEVRLITDSQTAVANILAGAVHFIADPILSVTEGQVLEQEWAQNKAGTVVYSPTSFRTTIIQLRPDYVEHPALLDVRTRRAIAHGMDRTTAVEVLTAGKGLATDTMTSPREVYYPQIERVIQKYPYDPGRAEQLMAEAGFKKGSEGLFIGQDGQPIRIMVASSTGARNETEMATYADGLRRAGFDVYQKAISARELAEPQFRALLPGMQIRGGENDLARYTSEQIPRPDNRWFGDNRGGWSNPEFDRLNDAILRTLDPAERVKQTAEMERLISTEVPLIPNYFDVYVAAHLANLQGPVGRQAPVQWDDPFMYIYKWEWRS